MVVYFVLLCVTGVPLYVNSFGSGGPGSFMVLSFVFRGAVFPPVGNPMVKKEEHYNITSHIRDNYARLNTA